MIRYLFNNGEAQTGLECSPSEMRKIESIFQAVQAPSNLRKRNVGIQERLLQSNADSIYQLSFDEALEINEYQKPSCDDSCKDFLPDKCVAFISTNVRHEVDTEDNHRDLQLSSSNNTKLPVDVPQKGGIYPASCKTKCKGQTDEWCQVPGCQGYRRELEDEWFPEDDGGNSTLPPSEGNPKMLLFEHHQGAYAPSCRSRCAGQTSQMCQGVPGCQGYRRELASENDSTFPPTYEDGGNKTIPPPTGRVYPPYCADRCRGIPPGFCREPGCSGYRRELIASNENETFVLEAPEEWCVKSSAAIDEKLNELLVRNQVSSQCRALILAPRRMECYNDQAICSELQ